MNRASHYILSIPLLLGIISLGYFLSLVFHLPLTVAIVMFAALAFCYYRYRKKLAPALLGDEKLSRLTSVVLTISLVIMTNQAYYLCTKYGGWDAWSIWNLQTKYLILSDTWKTLFLNTDATHTDYPLMIAATVAFFKRLFVGAPLETVSFAVHFLITISVPLLIFFEVYKRSILVAGLALVLMATDKFYLSQGLSMYADTALAFYFLAAIVTINHREGAGMVGLTGFFLGACIWTKNEGLVLSGIFILFYLKELINKRNFLPFLKGISIPMLVWLVFKIAYAPENDIVAGQGLGTLQHLQSIDRYGLIAKHFIRNLNQHFWYIEVGVVLYLCLAVLKRQYPEKQFLLIVCCLLAYSFVYLVTPHDLEWHLSTSQDRLMHQLLPATVYVIAMRFSRSGSSRPRAAFFSGWQRPA